MVSVSETEPVPFAAALLIPGTIARLQVSTAPAVLLAALYVKAVPLVVVAARLPDNCGITFGAAVPLPATLLQPFTV